jgi:hypothetical protein
MRRLFVVAVTALATRFAIRIARRLSKSRTMEHKFEELQDKFRGLDTISPTPTEPHE